MYWFVCCVRNGAPHEGRASEKVEGFTSTAACVSPFSTWPQPNPQRFVPRLCRLPGSWNTLTLHPCLTQPSTFTRRLVGFQGPSAVDIAALPWEERQFAGGMPPLPSSSPLPPTTNGHQPLPTPSPYPYVYTLPCRCSET